MYNTVYKKKPRKIFKTKTVEKSNSSLLCLLIKAAPKPVSLIVCKTFIIIITIAIRPKSDGNNRRANTIDIIN